MIKSFILKKRYQKAASELELSGQDLMREFEALQWNGNLSEMIAFIGDIYNLTVDSDGKLWFFNKETKKKAKRPLNSSEWACKMDNEPIYYIENKSLNLLYIEVIKND